MGLNKRAPLHPIPRLETLAGVNIDFFDTTRKQTHYCVCRWFSKWPEAVAVPDCTAKTVAQEIFRAVVCRHGYPRKLLSDCDPHFRAQMFKEILKQKSKDSSTSQTIEKRALRLNDLIVNANLRVYADKIGDEWD